MHKRDNQKTPQKTPTAFHSPSRICSFYLFSLSATALACILSFCSFWQLQKLLLLLLGLFFAIAVKTSFPNFPLLNNSCQIESPSCFSALQCCQPHWSTSQQEGSLGSLRGSNKRCGNTSPLSSKIVVSAHVEKLHFAFASCLLSGDSKGHQRGQMLSFQRCRVERMRGLGSSTWCKWGVR